MSEGARDGSRRWQVLAVVSATSAFMPFLDATVVNISFPSIEESFEDATRSGLSWVLSAYSIVFTALLVPGGRIGDALGRRRWFLIGLAVFTAASAACAAAPSAEVLVAARVLQAAGGAVMVPTGIALILAEFPLAQRSLAIALYGAVAAVAAAAGPPLGGVIVESADWRWIFLVNIPIGIVGGVWCARVVRESELRDARLPDFAGVVLVTAGVAMLALAIVQGEDWGWTSSRVLGAFAAAAVLLPLFVLRSASHPAPVVDLPLFRLRSFSVANLGTLLLGIAFFGSLLANVLFLTTVWGYSPLEAGLALTPAPLAAAVVAGAAGRLADRVGHRPIAIPGALCVAASGLWCAVQLGAEPAFVAEWLPGNLLLGIGLGLAYSTLISASTIELPSDQFALGSGINTMMRQLGAVLGVATVVAIVGTPAPAEALAAFDGAWRLITVLALAATAVCLALGRVGVPGHAPATEPGGALALDAPEPRRGGVA